MKYKKENLLTWSSIQPDSSESKCRIDIYTNKTESIIRSDRTSKQGGWAVGRRRRGIILRSPTVFLTYVVVATQITLQSRANHLLGLSRMAALTELARICFGGFLLTTRFPDFRT